MFPNSNSTSDLRKSQIQNRLDKIVAEGQSPNVSSTRKEILRRFYRFWKNELSKGEKSVINIEPLKPLVFEYLKTMTKTEGYISLPQLRLAIPGYSDSMWSLALQELTEEKKLLEENGKWAVPLSMQK